MTQWFIEESYGLDLFYRHAQYGVDAVKPIAGQPRVVNTNVKDVLVASYDGAMVLGDPQCSTGIRTFTDSIREFRGNFDAFVLRLETGGGHADAAMDVDGLIIDLQKKGVKVVVHSNSLYSAGIMATTNADRIVGNSIMSGFGSIGVFLQLNKYMRKVYNEYVEFVYSPESPDKNKAFNEWLKDGSTKEFKAQVLESDHMFMKMVSNNRPLSDKYQDTLKGGTWNAKIAKQRGLIDHIGSLDFAIDLATKLI